MISQRIVMLQDGRAVPQFRTEPNLSSAACGWKDVGLERHQLTMDEERSGVTNGYQIFLNLGRPAPVYWSVNGQSLSRVVATGQFSLTSHGNLHTVRWPKPMNILLLSLSTRLMMECSASKSRGLVPQLVEHFGSRDAQIEKLSHLLHADVVNGNPAGPVYGEQLGVALAVYLAKCFAVQPTSEKQFRNSLPGITLKRINEYIETHLSRSISLAQLAEQAGMSRFYFSRLFRNSTGETPLRFVTQCRVEKAKALLANRALTLREVADATGFSSQSRLTTIFKMKTGETPARYRMLTR